MPKNLQWWDESHHAMWRLTGWPSLAETLDHAKRVGQECAGARSAVLAALDRSGLASLMDPPDGSAARAGLAVIETARMDAGAAACLLSAYLPQYALRDYGTPEQCARYLDRSRYPHGALCLTEALPGAGMDALFLSGRVTVLDWPASGEPVLRVEKHGRFVSHMEFAHFVLVAVESADPRIETGCVLIVEPDDTGVFDRGSPVRKLGHRLSSITCPVFDLQLPPHRILGGYKIEDGHLSPNITYRQALAPALRFGRTMTSLMTAVKVLASVEAAFRHGHDDLDRLAGIWAGGEAAASLGFAAARACATRGDPILFPAAKLFSSAHAVTRMEAGSALTLMDAQVEAVFLGPEALQRREISARMGDSEFLEKFVKWTGEMEDLGVGCLVDAMRLWHWTVNYMRRSNDANGDSLFADMRQSTTFPLADALCRLLAARSFVHDVQQLPGSRRQPFSDLCALECTATAGYVLQICESTVFGYGAPNAVDTAYFHALRAAVYSRMILAPAARAAVIAAIRACS
jgi:hypothetical protein